MPEDHFGPVVARDYDADHADRFDPELLRTTVDRLAELAGDGAALELAIGTGRVGLPLAARGVPVTGIELSEAMVRELRGKPGGEDLPVTVGDMATTRVDGSFALVYLVFNTLPNLTSQDAQVACFANAAAHLRPGGSFVLEIGIPQLQHLSPGQRFKAISADDEYVGVDEIDVVTQRMWSHHLRDRGDGYRRVSVPFRYAWPSELDLMARLAGLELRHRWHDWNRGPLTPTSRSHVSVWSTPA